MEKLTKVIKNTAKSSFKAMGEYFFGTETIRLYRYQEAFYHEFITERFFLESYLDSLRKDRGVLLGCKWLATGILGFSAGLYLQNQREIAGMGLILSQFTQSLIFASKAYYKTKYKRIRGEMCRREIRKNFDIYNLDETND